VVPPQAVAIMLTISTRLSKLKTLFDISSSLVWVLCYITHLRTKSSLPCHHPLSSSLLSPPSV
jgi:hypothetical protein